MLSAWILHVHSVVHVHTIPTGGHSLEEWVTNHFLSRLWSDAATQLSISPSACASLVQHHCQAFWWGSRETAIALRCYSQPLNAALTLFLAHLPTWLLLQRKHCGVNTVDQKLILMDHFLAANIDLRQFKTNFEPTLGPFSLLCDSLTYVNYS